MELKINPEMMENLMHESPETQKHLMDFIDVMRRAAEALPAGSSVDEFEAKLSELAGKDFDIKTGAADVPGDVAEALMEKANKMPIIH